MGDGSAALKKTRQDPTERAAEAALAKELAAARERRAQAEVEYNLATENLYFSKDFNTAAEAIMRDELAPPAQRILAWVKRYSWGNYALFAIGDDGHPRFQVDCGKELGLKKRLVSKTVAYLQARGYLERQKKLLYPVIAPNLTTPQGNHVGKSPAWATFLDNWKVANAVDFQRWEDARAVDKHYLKVVHAAFRQEQKSLTAQKKGDSYLIRSATEGPKTPLRADLSPLEASNQRHKQAPANPANEGRTQSEDRANAQKLLFDHVEHMQQAFPDTPFARPLINRSDPGDQGLIDRVLKEIGTNEEDVIGFIGWCAAKFKGIGKGGMHVQPRAPGTARGPTSLGLLVNWAQDYGRVARPKARGAPGHD